MKNIMKPIVLEETASTPRVVFDINKTNLKLLVAQDQKMSEVFICL